jgi:hypothetical protein
VSPESAADAAQAFAAADPGATRRRTIVWQDPLPAAAAGAAMTGLDYMLAIVAGEVPPRRSR